MSDDKLCCVADALRRIRLVEINGIVTGITMLDECIAEVRAQNYGSETEIRAALLKKIRIYNYIPKTSKRIMYEPLSKNIKKLSRKSNTKKFEQLLEIP
jgi:hypothetical protein